MSLQLPKTKLDVSDCSLRKTGEDDVVVADLPLSDILDVRIEKTTDYVYPGGIISFFVALAVVSKLYVPWAGLDWVGVIVCLGMAGFAAMMIPGRKIVIETKDGAVGYRVSDTFEEADGFVLSLKQKLTSSATLASPTGAST